MRETKFYSNAQLKLLSDLFIVAYNEAKSDFEANIVNAALLSDSPLELLDLARTTKIKSTENVCILKCKIILENRLKRESQKKKVV
jgi:hypothetical protein